MYIQLHDISKKYSSGSETVHAITHANLLLDQGKWLTITGPSGSGKTTLLRCIAGLERADSGKAKVGNIDMMTANQEEIRKFRRNHIGYIFQDFQLFEQFDLLTNVMIPLLPFEKREVLESKARQLLDLVQLTDRIHHKPRLISGGEKQRAAIARALISEPNLVLCDEPTGNLDIENRDRVMNILKDIQQQGVTIVLVTHDLELSKHGDRVFEMRDGKLKEIGMHENNRI